MNKNRKGILVISLDFELLWGVFDKVQLSNKKEYFRNTRAVIPEILNLFEKHAISCTWATVGMLFNKDWDEWKENIPMAIPQYDKQELSAYEYGNSIISRETEEFCFAPDLIKKIMDTPGQEIGTHTYSHYYCLEPGQGRAEFAVDIETAVKVAERMGLETRSLVFPRNQYNLDYLEICKKNNIKAVRSNPLNWYWKDTQKSGLIEKLFRTGDAYLGINDKSYMLSNEEAEISIQKASRFLRPYSGKSVLESLKMKRIKLEMTYAAKRGEVYHLWWHPHNFGQQPRESMAQLEDLITHYVNCRRKYGFESRTMGDLTERANAG